MGGVERISLAATTLVLVVVVVLPAIAGAFAIVDSANQAGEFTGLSPAIVVRSAVWALVVALSALVIGWLPGRLLAWGSTGVRTATVACCLVPLCLGPHVLFWAWSTAWPADSALYAAALERGLVDHVRGVTLWCALVSWSWPIAALVLAAHFRVQGRTCHELRLIDGVGRVRGLLMDARLAVPALALAGLIIVVAVFNNTTAFDLANVRTVGNELRAIEAMGAGAGEVLRAGAAGIVLAVAAGFMGLVVIRARESVPPGARPVFGAGRAAVGYTAVLGLITVGGPLAFILRQRVDGTALGTVWAAYRGAAVNSLLVSAGAGLAACLLTLALAGAIAGGGPVARRTVRAHVVVWIVAAAVPAFVVWAGAESAYNRAWGVIDLRDWMYRQPWMLSILHLARFGFIAALIGLWLGVREHRAVRDTRLLERGSSLLGFIQANRPRVAAACAASFITTTVLALNDVSLAARVQPPGFETIAPITLNNMHYQRDELVTMMMIILFSVAVVGAIGLAVSWRMAGAARVSFALSLIIVCGCSESDPLAGEPLQPARTFGQAGRSLGQFTYPRAMDVDPQNGFLFIVDRSGRVQRFGLDGEPQLQWYLPAYDKGYPTGVTIAADGRLFVADTHEHRVSIFDSEGALIDTFGEYGEGQGQFIFPSDVAFGPDGRIYVSEFGGNDRIQVFSASFEFLFEFGSWGGEPGQFNRPQSISFDKARRELFVADSCNHRVQVFDPAGAWLRSIGEVGTEPGQFRYPYGVTILDDGHVLVSEFGNGRLQILTPAGDPVALLGRMGDGPGELRAPWTTASTGSEFFVLDSRNSRVQVIRRPQLD